MKRILTFILITLLLVSFISAKGVGITASAIDDENETDNNQGDNSENNQERESDNSTQNQARLTPDQIKNIITTRNRFRTHYTSQSECPNRCTCAGSVTRCQLEDGAREMTIRAGNSGNVIVQVKGVNASTNVSLYKSGDKIYGVFRNNETKEVKILPDQIRERIRERIQARLENQTIELDEDGIYQIRARKRARLLGFISVRARVNAEVDSETGEIIRVRHPWWNFLATDETEEESEEQ